MEYKNPIINSDYSDPDVIYHKGSYYLISSSFTDTPGLPILKSKNLVDWKILRYVYKNLPFDKYDEVMHGCGCWAPDPTARQPDGTRGGPRSASPRHGRSPRRPAGCR